MSVRAAPVVLFLCTGNATRSVLAAEILRLRRPDLAVVSAGTLTIDGLPMSVRTRAAFESIGVARPHHASRQAEPADLAAADLVVGLAPEHVAWVRRTHPAAAPRTATLIHMVDHLVPGPPALAQRVAALDLGGHTVTDAEEVVDPGGQEVDAYISCAHHVLALVDRLAPNL